MVVELTEIDKAYIAGILDGEGCIYIARNVFKKRGLNYNDKFQLQINVSMTDFVVPDFIHSKVGGSLYQIEANPKNRQYRLQKRWGIGNQNACNLLINLLPYLKVKKLQAILGIEFHTYKMNNQIKVGFKRRTKPEVMEKYREYFKKMQDLKKYPINE